MSAIQQQHGQDASDDNALGFDSGPSMQALMQGKELAAAVAARPAGSQPSTPNTKAGKVRSASRANAAASASDGSEEDSDEESDDEAGPNASNSAVLTPAQNLNGAAVADSSSSEDSSSGSDEEDDADSDGDEAGVNANKRARAASAAAAPKAGTPSGGVTGSAAAAARKRGSGKHAAPSEGVRAPGPGAVPFPQPADEDDSAARARSFHELALATAAAGKGGELATRARSGAAVGPGSGGVRPSGTLRPPGDRPIAFSMVTMQPTVMTEFVRIIEPALKAIDPNSSELQIWVTKSPDFEGMVVDMILGGEMLIVNARLAVSVDIFPPAAMSRDEQPPVTPAEILLVVDPTLLLQTLGTIKPYAELCMYMEWTRDKLCFMTRDGTERTRYTSMPLICPKEAVYHSVLNLPMFDFDANIPAAELKGDVAQAVHARAVTINLHLRARTAKSWLFCVSAESDRQCLHNVLPIWITDDALCGGASGDAGAGDAPPAEPSARIRGEYKTDRVRASNDPMPSCESEVLALPALFGISIKCRLLQAILKNIPEDRYILLSLIRNEPLIIRTVVNTNHTDSHVTFVVSPYTVEQDAA